MSREEGLGGREGGWEGKRKGGRRGVINEWTRRTNLLLQKPDIFRLFSVITIIMRIKENSRSPDYSPSLPACSPSAPGEDGTNE